ncbi:cytochrome P450 family protein [Umezawaea beigongshangensis]|uniref:cytochrome P450 family protein n=1 Tax=Umezawaea beigongshangensis TaxID=2780383 RepID=UPI0018F21360|nr:cytochrome P450 [Umezawaea beigongshangensis]
MGAPSARVESLDLEYLKDPYPVHDRLREQAPVSEVVLPRGLRAWLVTRYDEARTALADPRFGKDMQKPEAAELFERHSPPGAEQRDFDQSLSAHMLNSDPPQHTRLRKLVTKAFTSRRVELMRPRIQQITEELLDSVAERDEVDLLDALAFPLPITVICELLDVPLDQRDEFRTWSNTLLSSSSTAEEAGAASQAMAVYLADLVEHKRANPGEDMLSALIHAEDDGDNLDRTELISMAFLLLVAGHETTVNLIGNGVLALLRNPDQLRLLREDPGLLHNAIEEFLRYEGPLNQATLRYTTEDVELGGVLIPAGEIVVVSLMGANRDAARFADPDRLDITRQPGGHVAFGHGIHFCLGAPLARLEGEIAVGTLLKRFPDLALAAEPETLRWRESTLIRGLHTLPVRLS